MSETHKQNAESAKEAEEVTESPCENKFKATEETMRTLLVNMQTSNEHCTVSGNMKRKRGFKTKTIRCNESSSSSDGGYDECESGISWAEELGDD